MVAFDYLMPNVPNATQFSTASLFGQGTWIDAIMEEILRKIIDDQELIFLSNQQWTAALQNKTLNSLPISDMIVERVNRVELPLTMKHEELILTGAFIGVDKGHFFPFVLLRNSESYQRIFLDAIVCTSCNWKGWAGNPCTMDAYLGRPQAIPDHILMQKARKLDAAKCPQCNSVFDRFFVWAGNLD